MKELLENKHDMLLAAAAAVLIVLTLVIYGWGTGFLFDRMSESFTLSPSAPNDSGMDLKAVDAILER